MRMLYTGGSDSVIHVYELETFSEHATLPNWNPYFHQNNPIEEKNTHKGPV